MCSPPDFEEGALDHARHLASSDHYQRLLEQKCTGRTVAELRKPLEAYRVEELAEMSRDIFDDRNGFAAARRSFATRQKPTATPARLARHRPAMAATVSSEDAARHAS